MRVVRVSAGCVPHPSTLPAGWSAYHLDPLDATYGEAVEAGWPLQPLPEGEDLPGLCLLMAPTPPRGDHGALLDLVRLVDRLLGPGGCPWDRAQTHETLKRHLLEEAYEVLDAIDTADPAPLCEELGDLLLQPIMHAQMAKLSGDFSIDEVAQGIVDKLLRRHPHVFGDVQASTPEAVLKNWDEIKKKEKGLPRSVLAGVPLTLPSLLRAYEVNKRAARTGFEWPDQEGVFDKLREEEAELREAIQGGDSARIEAELGDLLFTIVNLARWAGVEPEEALRKMVNRFCRRFEAMELAAHKPLRELSLAEWDDLWEIAKKNENA